MCVNERLGPAVRWLFRHYSEPVQQMAVLLAETGAHRVRADVVARRAGFPDRDALYDALKEAGLRPLTDLASLVRVPNWSLEASDHGLTLTRIAQSDGHYPVQYFRTVRRAFGKPWSESYELEPTWVLERMQEGAMRHAEVPVRRSRL